MRHPGRVRQRARPGILLRSILCSGLCLLLLSAGCANGDAPEETADPPEFLVKKLGGETSAREFRGRPFNQSARSLSNEEFRRFGKGAIPFDKEYEPDEGLGPAFNSDSCLGCHTDEIEPGTDFGEDAGPGILLRLSVPGVTATGAPMIEPTYGLQLQTEAVTGDPEGAFAIEWVPESGSYPDGTAYELRSPRITLGSMNGGPIADETMMSLRLGPPLLALGLLEAIPEEELLASEDPEDTDGDGISGRTNTVWNATTGSTDVGRFGWKAGQPSVRQQTAGALHDDMGVTSSDAPDPCAGQGSLCTRTDPASWPAPELGDEEFDDMVFYNRTIGVPIARMTSDPAVISGANEFDEVGCSACHTTTWTSGPDEVKGLSGITFYPFTDLLLHDMGDGLADGRPEFEATGREWRTPPLWGFSRRAETTGYATFLHDGRARNAEEAILWHGGEADAARDNFMELPKERREKLRAYLESI